MDLFKPIKTKKIYEEIVEQIRLLIRDGDLRPGERLLSERELSERLGVSRASVREALCALEIMGLIEQRPGEGTFIRQTSVDTVIGPMALVLSVEQDTILELLQVRKVLEVEAVGLAATRASEQEKLLIKQAVEQMELDLNQGRLGDEADLQFHFAIAGATGNSILMRLMNTISDTMQQTLLTSRKKLYQSKGTPERLYMEHKQIYEAVAAGNQALARQLMYSHLEKVEQQMDLK